MLMVLMRYSLLHVKINTIKKEDGKIKSYNNSSVHCYMYLFVYNLGSWLRACPKYVTKF
jgi:hypothetical protein